MQEYPLNLEQVGDLTFTQFNILLGELARQNEEAEKAHGKGSEPKTQVLKTREQTKKWVDGMHARGIGKPK